VAGVGLICGECRIAPIEHDKTPNVSDLVRSLDENCDPADYSHLNPNLTVTL
jgi:hypothetical protein